MSDGENLGSERAVSVDEGKVPRVESHPKRIVLMNDLPGIGKVALAAMAPILSWMGYEICQLPTAMVSNTLDFGKFRIQDMTDYMRDTIRVWDELGMDPDAICTGFILSVEQAELIEEYIRSRVPGKERMVLVDPIMADGGRLYNGIGEERVDALRRLAALSDVMVPNMTEASFLTGIRPGQETGTPEEIRELVDGLHGISQGSVVITSAFDTESGQHVVSGYDHWNQNYFTVPYEYIPARVAGSGDIFSAVMTGELLRGKMLSEAVKKAVRVLTEMIRADQVCQHEYRWISVERYLDRFPDYGV